MGDWDVEGRACKVSTYKGSFACERNPCFQGIEALVKYLSKLHRARSGRYTYCVCQHAHICNKAVR